jgi:hypothetical protein
MGTGPPSGAAADRDRYLRRLSEPQGLRSVDYCELWRWSTDDTEGFLRSIWGFFGRPGSQQRAIKAVAIPGVPSNPESAGRALARNDFQH